MSDREDTIRSRAYRIWEQENQPDGRHEEHWEQAEREIGAEGKATEPSQQDGSTDASSERCVGPTAPGREATRR
jgi:hypothetical protein